MEQNVDLWDHMPSQPPLPLPTLGRKIFVKWLVEVHCQGTSIIVREDDVGKGFGTAILDDMFAEPVTDDRFEQFYKVLQSEWPLWWPAGFHRDLPDATPAQVMEWWQNRPPPLRTQSKEKELEECLFRIPWWVLLVLAIIFAYVIVLGGLGILEHTSTPPSPSAATSAQSTITYGKENH
jgi:hypothetical protein